MKSLFNGEKKRGSAGLVVIAVIAAFTLILILGSVFNPKSFLSLSKDSQAATSINISPTDDTFVRSSTPQTNYGTSPTMEVDTTDTSYMKFDLTQFADKIISTAKLHMKIDDAAVTTSTQHLKMVLDTSWDENTLTYENKPPLSTEITSMHGGAATTWAELDITSLVTLRKGGLMAFGIDTTDSDGIQFVTKEEPSVEDRPYITVEYTQLTPPVPTATQAPTLVPSVVPSPTISSPPNTTTMITEPVADAYVEDTNPTTNYGTDTTLLTDTSPGRITFMRFNLAPVTVSSITSAKLRIYVTDATSSQQTIRLVNDTTWGEKTITYNTKPAASSTASATFNGGQIGQWVDVDVTSAIQSKLGQLVSLSIEGTQNYKFGFNSREASNNHPVLIVQYPNPNTPTATPTPAGGGFGGITLGQTVSGIIYVSFYSDQSTTNFVRFYLDNKFINDDTTFSYNLGGDLNGVLQGFDTRQLSNGLHTLKAEIHFKDGTVQTYQITFTVNNTAQVTPVCISPPTCTSGSTDPLCNPTITPFYGVCTPTAIPTATKTPTPTLTSTPPPLPTASKTPTPTNTPMPYPSATPTPFIGFGGISLGQTVSGYIFVTFYSDQNLTNFVRFYIDTPFINDESIYPYSLGGRTNGTLNGYDTRQLSNGQHTLQAEIHFKDGTVQTYQITFIVNNPVVATATSSPTTTAAPQCPMKPQGDANCDNKVDMIDFEIWREEFIGQVLTHDADFNTSNKTDLIDFETWRQGFVAKLVP